MNFIDPANFEQLRQIRRHETSTFLIAVAALQNGLDVVFYRSQAEAGTRHALFSATVDKAIFYSVSDGRRRHFLIATQTDQVSASTASVTGSKAATKELLHRKNIDTAIGGPVSAANPRLLHDLARAGVRRFVLKPAVGSLGKGTFVNQTAQQAADVLRLNPSVEYVIEQYISGREHRVYVVDDKVVAAYWHRPPSVEGDGALSIRALYARHQAERAGNPFIADRGLATAEIELALLLQQVGWDSVPAAGQRVWLNTKPFPDGQSEFFVCTDALPDAIRKTALAAARAVASRNCAIDMMVTPAGQAFVLEVNSRPMIGVHCFPHPTGRFNLEVPQAILRSLFPQRSDPVREVETLDFQALRAEVFRDGRTTKGVDAAGFATFAALV